MHRLMLVESMGTLELTFQSLFDFLLAPSVPAQFWGSLSDYGDPPALNKTLSPWEAVRTFARYGRRLSASVVRYSLFHLPARLIGWGALLLRTASLPR